MEIYMIYKYQTKGTVVKRALPFLYGGGGHFSSAWPSDVLYPFNQVMQFNYFSLFIKSHPDVSPLKSNIKSLLQ